MNSDYRAASPATRTGRIHTATMKKLFLVLALALAVLPGCLTGGRTPGLSGEVSGGKEKQRIASNVVAAMNGGLIGGSIGQGLGDGERRSALEAEYRALEYTPAGQRVSWNGKERRGEVVAAPPYRVGSQDCRQYTQTVFSGTGQQSARGTACRNSDGSWTPLT